MATGPTTSPVPESRPQLPLLSQQAERKHTWQELHSAVKATRRLQTSLTNRVPTEFTFRTVMSPQGMLTRLYFLGIPPGNRENTLLYADIHEDGVVTGGSPEGVVPNVLQWNPLLVPFRGLAHTGFSKEEQLLRERKRLGSFGITTYDVDIEAGKFLFPASGSLFTCSDPTLVTQPVFPQEVVTMCTGVRLDSKLCPSNSSIVSFVHSNDLWVTNTATGEEKRLTFAHKGLSNICEDPKSAGVASYIIQEEFDRYTGYWWQPAEPRVTSTIEGAVDPPRVYRILYEEVDESDVEILHIVSSTYGVNGVDDYRYPRSGTANAKVDLKMMEFVIDSEGKISQVEDKVLAESLDTIFPWMEYIVRVGWTPDGNNVWAQLLNRNQQDTAIVMIPLENFVCATTQVASKEVDEGAFAMNTAVGAGDIPPVKVLYEEHSDIWINIHDTMHMFNQTSPDELSFIWASEATGTRHLYYIKSALKHPGSVPGNLKPAILKYQMLTSGEGEVTGQQVWVDDVREMVYYLALHDTPLEEHLYAVSYSSPGPPVRLTQLGFNVHTAALSPDQRYFACTQSNLTTQPFTTLFKLNHSSSQPITVTSSEHCKLLPMPTLPNPCIPPELFTYKHSQTGQDMYGLLYKPHNLEPGKQYPTVLFVYGGPQVQLVTRSYKGMRLLRLHTLASLGYAVVVIDSRGSSSRGLKFEGILKHRLGSVEVEDQIEGLHWVAAKTGFIDLSRVAIHGWSYGGYMSLMGLAKRPNVFKVAIAGAPVTCWKVYDTGYTERYMDTPLNNPAGYSEASILNMAKDFPNEENRLLIVHGLIDENVHFHHTSLLIDELIKNCKPYHVQIYPQERHGIRKPDASEHYETMVLSWLQQNL